MIKIVYSTEELFDGKIYKIFTCKVTTKKERKIAKMFGTDCGNNTFVFHDNGLKSFSLARKEMTQAENKNNNSRFYLTYSVN